MSTAQLNILNILDTPDGGIEVHCEFVISAEAQMVGIIYYPSQITSGALPEDRQRQLAEMALADFGPATLTSLMAAAELDRYYA